MLDGADSLLLSEGGHAIILMVWGFAVTIVKKILTKTLAIDQRIDRINERIGDRIDHIDERIDRLAARLALLDDPDAAVEPVIE